MQPLGKTLLVAGIIMACVGAVLMFSDKIPFLGKLPGDIHIKREHFEFFFPITSGLLISIVISIALWIFSHFKGR